MSRLKRKNRTYEDIGIMSSGGMLDAVDNAIKEAYRINDEEYDYLCDKMTDEELSLFASDNFTFSQKRQILTLLNKYLNERI
jgi:hypothetical protein